MKIRPRPRTSSAFRPTKAMLLPSGDQRGSDAITPGGPTGVGSAPVVESTTSIVATRLNAIRFPSGDHEGSRPSTVPGRAFRPDPSALTTKICVSRWHPSPQTNEFTQVHSVNAARFPSRDHTGGGSIHCAAASTTGVPGQHTSNDVILRSVVVRGSI